MSEASGDRYLLPPYLGGGEVLASPMNFTLFGEDLWMVTFPDNPFAKQICLPKHVLRRAPCKECGRPYTSAGGVSFG